MEEYKDDKIPLPEERKGDVEEDNGKAESVTCGVNSEWTHGERTSYQDSDPLPETNSQPGFTPLGASQNASAGSATSKGLHPCLSLTERGPGCSFSQFFTTIQGEACYQLTGEPLISPASEGYLQTQRAYFNPDLARSLAEDRAATLRTTTFKHSAKHDFTDSNTIRSQPESEDRDCEKFKNTFFPDIWLFRANFRDDDHKDYYNSDVIRAQYEMVSRRNGFYGWLPSKIVRESVINRTTLSVMKKAIEDNIPLADPFLTQTPNGKSTLRILADFKLRATSVRYTLIKGEYSFIVSVEPLSGLIKFPQKTSDESKE